MKFSPSEMKLLKKVLVFSAAGSAVMVGGVWLFFTLQLKHGAGKIREAAVADNSPAIQDIDLEAHRAIASRYMQIGASEKAVPHLKRILALKPKNYPVLRDLADASLEAGLYQEALGYYDLLLKKMDTDSITGAQCARRGIALFYLNRTEESREVLLDCSSRFPGNAEAWCFLGQIEAFRNLSSQNTLNYFNRALAADSAYTEGWYQLARYYMEQKVYTRARELLLRAIAVNPFHSKSHSRLGMVYYYLDYPELSRKSYQTALVLNPDDFNTHYNLGELLYGVLHDTVEALKEFKAAYVLNPKLYEAAFKIGLISMKNGMDKEAVRYFEAALERAPDDIRILLQCAVAWERIGRDDRAAEKYREVLAIDELNSIARQKLKLLTGN